MLIRSRLVFLLTYCNVLSYCHLSCYCYQDSEWLTILSYAYYIYYCVFASSCRWLIWSCRSWMKWTVLFKVCCTLTQLGSMAIASVIFFTIPPTLKLRQEAIYLGEPPSYVAGKHWLGGLASWLSTPRMITSESQAPGEFSHHVYSCS